MTAPSLPRWVSHHLLPGFVVELYPIQLGKLPNFAHPHRQDGKQYPTRKTKATVEKAPTKTDAEPDEYATPPLAEIGALQTLTHWTALSTRWLPPG